MKMPLILLLIAAGLSVAYTGVNSQELAKHTNKYFTLYAPAYMEKSNDLNSEASLQLAYVEKVNEEVMELYTIVLVETKKEIASYNLEVELHALSYWELAVKSLEGSLTNYEVLTESPQVEKINGNDAVRSEMYGELGEVSVRYKLAVIEGKKAFYQVLTWTIDDQLAYFTKDMDKMLDNFVGK